MGLSGEESARLAGIATTLAGQDPELAAMLAGQDPTVGPRRHRWRPRRGWVWPVLLAGWVVLVAATVIGTCIDLGPAGNRFAAGGVAGAALLLTFGMLAASLRVRRR